MHWQQGKYQLWPNCFMAYMPLLKRWPHIMMTSQWQRWRLRSPASRLFTQPFIQTQIKRNIKAPRHWPLCGEFTGDRWIPRTNGQLRGKCFHLMTSSCKLLETPLTAHFVASVLTTWPWPIRKKRIGTSWAVSHILATAAGRFWAGTILHWAAYTWHCV